MGRVVRLARRFGVALRPAASQEAALQQGRRSCGQPPEAGTLAVGAGVQLRSRLAYVHERFPCG